MAKAYLFNDDVLEEFTPVEIMAKQWRKTAVQG
jgi:hypothetical protein